MKAISGPKLKPTDQGPLTGALKNLGFDETQVCFALGDVTMDADIPMRTGLQILEGWLTYDVACVISLLYIDYTTPSPNPVPPLM